MPIAEIVIYVGESPDEMGGKCLLAWNECHPEAPFQFWRGRDLVAVNEPPDDGIGEGSD